MASTTMAPSPTNHIHGASAAIARPPSSGVTGSRLKRFRKKPVKASACHRSLPVAAAIGRHAAAPIVPRIGPARPTRASASALPPSDFAHTTAPRKGMKTGALASTPSRRSCDDVAHLVDEEQHDEPDGEPPAPDQRVGGHRDEHRARGGEHLDLGQQQQDRLELGPDHGQRREQAAAGAPPPRTLRLAERRGALRRRFRRRRGQPAGRKLVGALLAHLTPRIGCRRCSSTSVTRACT